VLPRIDSPSGKAAHAQSYGGKLSAYPALDMLCRPTSECRRSPGLVHQAHHSSQNHQEYQNSDIVPVEKHAHNTILEGKSLIIQEKQADKVYKGY
jgi:hypothetical protein